ncbi:MAG: DUF6516 family protein [Chloroflexota bacterium]
MQASDYTAYIRSLLIAQVRDGILVRQSRPIDIKTNRDNQGGSLLANNPGLIFKDDAILRVEERFRVGSDSRVLAERYAYHYERPSGYYFRYEYEHHDGDKHYKPEYHLHVGWRLPHFPATPMTLESILKLIRVNFYDDVHRERLVGQRLATHI